MNDSSSSTQIAWSRHLFLTLSVLSLLLSFSSPLWATGGAGAAPGAFTPRIEEVTATPTDNAVVISALITPLSAVSEAQIEYGLTTDYGGTQWSRTGVLETPASNIPTNLGDQVGSYRMTFTITGLQPAQTYHYRIFANNVTYFGFVQGSTGVPQPLGGAAYSLDALFTTTGNGPPRSFEAWRQLAFTPSELADESISGPYATPQGSSPCNLIKFYFGYPPTAASGDGSPQFSNLPTLRLRTSENLTQSSLFFTRVSAATEVSLAIETSTDVTTWVPIALPSLITSSATGHLETVEVPLNIGLTTDSPKSFYRVKLTPTPP